MCFQKCSSAYPVCNEWLEVVWPSERYLMSERFIFILHRIFCNVFYTGESVLWQMPFESCTENEWHFCCENGAKAIEKNLFLSFFKLLSLLLLLVLSFSKSLDHIYFTTPAKFCAGYKLRVNRCMLNGTLETNASEECDITFTGGWRSEHVWENQKKWDL